MPAASPLLFTCSLDDGHPADLRAAGILARHGFPATFYIPIRNREGAPLLTLRALRELASGFDIGSHTLDHVPLRALDAASARHQIVEGKLRLEQLIGRRVEGFCYPAGKYRRDQVALVRAAGFRYARSTVNLCLDAGRHPYEMPTTLQFYPHPRAVYLRNFLRGGRWPRRLPGLSLAMRHQAWPDRLYAAFNHACLNGGIFHLWGHSKDLQETNAWDEFDRFLGHAASCLAPADRLSNSALAQRSFAPA